MDPHYIPHRDLKVLPPPAPVTLQLLLGASRFHKDSQVGGLECQSAPLAEAYTSHKVGVHVCKLSIYNWFAYPSTPLCSTNTELYTCTRIRLCVFAYKNM